MRPVDTTPRGQRAAIALCVAYGRYVLSPLT